MTTAPGIVGPPGPPAPLKVFAPNGDTGEFLGWLCVAAEYSSFGEKHLFVILDAQGNKTVKLSRRVVVQNMQLGLVIYDPRKVELEGYFTEEDYKWLDDNPTWPNILEVYDRPVLGSDDKPKEVDRDGLYG